jgi:hypothetical protein
MGKTKYHWDVDVPKEGPLSREQAWAALESIKTSLSLVGYRSGARGGDPEDSPLSREEVETYRTLMHRFEELTSGLSLDVLDRLATIKSDEDDDPYEGVPKKFPENVRKMLGDYYSDIYRYSRTEKGHKAVLAFAILEDDGWAPEEIGELIEKNMRPDDKYTDVWPCPQCDPCTYGKIGEVDCNRCYAWGYVFGEEPDLSEYDWTEKGRLALNRGETWTPEQEAEEEARLQAEWDAD